MSISNHLKIIYGKYLNNLPNELSTEHIIPGKSGIISRRVEPGEPNFPSAETYTFALANLAPDGTQRYPLSFWENAARTQGEGATQPLQIYFQIYVDDGEQFLGMLKSLNYGKNNGIVTVQVGDVLEIARGTKIPILAPIEGEVDLIAEHPPATGRNDLDVAHDIDGDEVQHAALSFLVENKYSTDEYAELENPFAVHFGLTSPDFTNPYESTPRSAWVQIGEKTILTRIQIIKKKGIFSSPSVYNRFHRMEMVIWHNAEDPYTIEGTGDAGDTVILPRGQFTKDNEKLSFPPGGAHIPVNLILYEPDLGNGTSALAELADTPLEEDFIFGVPYTVDTGFIQITSATYSYFDAITKTTDMLEKLINDTHSDSGEALLDLIDDSRATKYRHAFWADIVMYGWADKTLAEALVAAARQAVAYLYTDRFGDIIIHSREYSQDLLDSGAPETRLVQNEHWEELDGADYQHGFATYSAEVPFDVIEIDNVVSEESAKIYSDVNGAVNAPALRNKPVTLANFRIFDLGVPDQGDTSVPQPVLRLSPGDASWPNAETLDDFVPTPRNQLNIMAAAFPWPTPLLRIKLGRDYINNEVDVMGTPTAKNLDYIVDENDQLWWVREETLDINQLAVELLIQFVGALNAES